MTKNRYNAMYAVRWCSPRRTSKRLRHIARAFVLGMQQTVYWELVMAVDLSRFALLALDCVHRQYPNKIAHHLNSDADARSPRELTPAFYGCYDWHSCVHGHWLLARLARQYPDGPESKEIRKALDENLAEKNIAGELAYLGQKERKSFERTYGWAWLLKLQEELRTSP